MAGFVSITKRSFKCATTLRASKSEKVVRAADMFLLRSDDAAENKLDLECLADVVLMECEPLCYASSLKSIGRGS